MIDSILSLTENFGKKHVDSIAKFAEIDMATRKKEAVLQHVILFYKKFMMPMLSKEKI